MASAVVNVMDFRDWNVADLKNYLKLRGVRSSNEKKADLVELCTRANLHELQVDPDGFTDDIKSQIKAKLVVRGNNIPHPDRLVGSSDLSKLPPIDQFDVYN